MAAVVNRMTSNCLLLGLVLLLCFYDNVRFIVGEETIEETSTKNCSSRIAEKDLDIVTKDFITDHSNTLSVFWAGDDGQTFLIAAINDKKKPSQLYRSEDGGLTIENQTSILRNATILKVVVNPHTRNRVIIVAVEPFSAQTTFFTSTNAGKNYSQTPTRFYLRDEILLNPHNPDFLLALGNKESQWTAFLSRDYGYSWTSLQPFVLKAAWSLGISDLNNTIYLLCGSESHFRDANQRYTLKKSIDLGSNFTVIAENVTSFQSRHKFLFVTVQNDQMSSNSILRVSSTGGRKWNEVQLPTIQADEFYKVVDSSDGMVFIHVNTKTDDGPGTLFTSDADGIIFAESLRQHLYTSDGKVTDFYKVTSMRGVYITNQRSKSDNSIHAMITFNRGGIWERIKVPKRIPCHRSNQTCSLQFAYKYSESRSVPVPQGPLSTEAAPGMIVIHGYVWTSLRNDTPDVFISSDGGYTWRKALDGPHFYVIGNYGAVLAAVPQATRFTKIIKISVNEGNEWQCTNFTSEEVLIRSVSTDPQSKSLKVVIVSQNQNLSLSKWHLTVVDLKKHLGKECTDSDLQEFLPHQGHSLNKSFDGCLLGLKQIFRKAKGGVRCYLPSNHQIKYKETRCSCSKDDYECDYGYFRPNDKDSDCVENPKFKYEELDVCIDGEEREIETTGYRKIPGDQCISGWDPVDFHKKDLKHKCREGDKRLLSNLYNYPDNTMKNAVIAIIVMTVVITVLIMAVYFIKKVQQLNKFTPSYRYSRLNQEDLGAFEDSKHMGNGQIVVDASGDEDDQLDPSEAPATLVVPSQTVTDKHNWSIQERRTSSTVPSSETSLGDQSLRNLLDDTDDVLVNDVKEQWCDQLHAIACRDAMEAVTTFINQK